MSFWNTFLNTHCVQRILTETCPGIYWYFRTITWCILQTCKRKKCLLLHFSVYSALNSLQTCSSNKRFQFITESLGSGRHNRLNTWSVSKVECTTFFRWKVKYGDPAQMCPFKRVSIHGRVRCNRTNRVGSPFSPVHLRMQAVPASRLVFQVFYTKWRILYEVKNSIWSEEFYMKWRILCEVKNSIRSEEFYTK